MATKAKSTVADRERLAAIRDRVKAAERTRCGCGSHGSWDHTAHGVSGPAQSKMVWAGCPNCRGKSLGAGIPAADLDWYDRHPQVVGERIGRAIARDAKAEGMAAEWTGLGAQDGDVATSAGLEPGTPEWEEMERAAKIEFLRAMESR